MFPRVEVVDGDYLAIFALHTSRIAEVPGSSVLPQHDFIAPGAPLVAADARTQSEGLQTAAVDERKAIVAQLHQARWIASGFGRRLPDALPGCAVILRKEAVDEFPITHAREDGLRVEADRR